MKNKIELSDNHRRVISVILRLIEKDLDYIEQLLNDPKSGITYKVEKDIEIIDIGEKKEIIRKIRDVISNVYSKYDLYKEIQTQTRIISAKKIHLWEILIDSDAKNLNKYGEFDLRHAENYNTSIQNLIRLIEEI
jgi:hypothetical protein